MSVLSSFLDYGSERPMKKVSGEGLRCISLTEGKITENQDNRHLLTELTHNSSN